MVLTPNNFDGHPLLRVHPSALEASLVMTELVSYGLDITNLTHRIFIARSPCGYDLPFLSMRGVASTDASSAICKQKHITKSVLNLNSVPTAPGLRVSALNKAVAQRFVENNGWPVVVKPVSGIGGKGVTANISSYDQLWEAALLAADSQGGYLLEKHVPGDDHRFLVIGGQVVGVWSKEAANVVGDGVSPISALIDQRNIIRKSNPHLISRPIRKDALVKNHLGYNGLDLGSVPGSGEKVYLRSASNLSSGGDHTEISEKVHPSLIDIAIKAAKAIPATDLLGLDLLLEDPFVPAHEQIVNVCEINENPALSAHDFPMFGAPKKAGLAYVDYLLESRSISHHGYSDTRVYAATVFGDVDARRFLDHFERVSEGLLFSVSHSMGSSGISLKLEGHSGAIAACLSLLIRPPVAVGSMSAITARLLA